MKIFLREMGYKEGSKINTLKTKTFLCVDGDGTIYAGPKQDKFPLLEESECCYLIKKYLEYGGVLVLISGNEIKRTINRIETVISEDLRNRVIVYANGSADMVIGNNKGEWKEYKDYSNNALKYKNIEQESRMIDWIYIGDDVAEKGNDYPAYNFVGKEKSLCVGDINGIKKEEWLWGQHIKGYEKGTAKFLEQMIEDINRVNKNIFTKENIERWVKNSNGNK